MKRLNKYITDAGYCSRREADNYISQGRVTVNGRPAVLGDMVSDMDAVEVDGERVGRRKKAPVYIVCNKPVGVTCTSERSDKTNIIDFLGYKERIFPVGRLDKDSHGLIILTNDGDIVNKILRAGNNNPKEYIVTVDKPMTAEFISRMAGGVDILGVTTKPCKIVRRNASSFTIHLTQGLNRQIRRMCQALGYKVVSLKRVKVMNISLGNLEPGRWRYLTPEETQQMHLLLAASSGTEEASNERKARKAHSPGKLSKQGTYSGYRQNGIRKKDSRESGKSANLFKSGDGTTKSDKVKNRSGRNTKSGESLSANPSARSKIKGKDTASPTRPGRRGAKAGKTLSRK